SNARATPTKGNGKSARRSERGKQNEIDSSHIKRRETGTASAAVPSCAALSAARNARRWEATDAVRDHSAGSGLQARLPRRTEERAAMIRWLKEMLLLNLLLVPPMVFFPAICWLLAAHPDPTAAQACFWFGPLSAGFWVLVYSQWSSAMAWQRMGRLKQWREDHGGFLCTIPRACGWLFLGIVGSFACEILFMLAF